MTKPYLRVDLGNAFEKEWWEKAKDSDRFKELGKIFAQQWARSIIR